MQRLSLSAKDLERGSSLHGPEWDAADLVAGHWCHLTKKGSFAFLGSPVPSYPLACTPPEGPFFEGTLTSGTPKRQVPCHHGQEGIFGQPGEG